MLCCKGHCKRVKFLDEISFKKIKLYITGFYNDGKIVCSAVYIKLCMLLQN